MRKKWMAMFLAASCLWAVPVMAENELNTSEENYTYPSEEAPEEIWESTLGYSMQYDPKLFTLDDTGEGDSFLYNTAEELKAPVYIAVLAYPEMDAEDLAKGVALQNDVEETEIQDTFFGANSLETKCIYREQEYENAEEEETVKTMQVFYAVPTEEGSLLVEIMGYEGMPADAEVAFEKMLGSFQLIDLEERTM